MKLQFFVLYTVIFLYIYVFGQTGNKTFNHQTASDTGKGKIIDHDFFRPRTGIYRQGK